MIFIDGSEIHRSTSDMVVYPIIYKGFYTSQPDFGSTIKLYVFIRRFEALGYWGSDWLVARDSGMMYFPILNEERFRTPESSKSRGSRKVAKA